MDKMLVSLVVAKVIDFARKRILEEEIKKGAGKGLEKFQAVKDNFFAKAKEFVLKCKKEDNKFIPNEFEDVTEDVIIGILEGLEAETDVDNLIETIFGIEKADLAGLI